MIRRAAAGQRLQSLVTDADGNREAIKALGREHGLVTPFTSLLVLDSLAQYIEHDVQPPASLATMRKKWQAAQDRKLKSQKTEERGKLDRVVAMWKTYMAWYDKDFPKQLPKPKRKAANKSVARGGSVSASNDEEMSAFGIGGVEVRGTGTGGGGSGGSGGAGGGGSGGSGGAGGSVRRAAAERPPTSTPPPSMKEAVGHPQAAIALKGWKPDAPYTKAIEQVAPQRRYAAYLEQRKTFGEAMSFYLDVADLFRKDSPELALRILSNIAELDLESATFLRVLAHRLAQWDELDLAATIFSEVMSLRPEEPQSLRDLALVLARRGDAAKNKAAARADYERAMALLAKVVMNEWERFAEIELIALVELNRIWPKAKAHGTPKAPIDKRLLKRIAMDVRIVMTWDADLTDMDLHVVEPTQQEAYFGFNLTHIGGRVSRDFTQGYGPEVYAQRDAPKGEYKISAKFYSSAAVAVTGPVTLQVEVFTNYGRKNEERRAMTFRLKGQSERFNVGVIEL